MAITTFIPTVWTETLNRALNQEYIGVAHCNRDFEGEIKNCGSTVKICKVGGVEIFEYEKGTELLPPQSVSSSVSEMTVDRARYFNFLIDDVDRVQRTPHLMNVAMQSAANSLAIEADRYVFSLYHKAGSYIEEIGATPENVLDPLYKARTLLLNAGVNDLSQAVFEVSPEVANLLLKSKMLVSHDNTTVWETGSIGSVLGIPVFVSSNINTMVETGATRYQCLVRTRRAIAFAEQISQIEAYRPDNCFADAVKGLHLYGASVVYPNEMACIDYVLLDN